MLLGTVVLHIGSFIAAATGLATDKREHASSETGPIIDLGYAKYQGARLDTGVDHFLGMRYAKAPLGNLRFRAPEDPAIESKVQDASNFGPICPGIGDLTTPNARGPYTDTGNNATLAEDCLFVNVFKPSGARVDSKLPVWVQISGGGYAGIFDANYNGTGVVKQSGGNIVYVHFNYRVGALGFLASEQIRQDGDLNAGLLDQRKLLHWVQKHIHKFGGDPRHVVIHGISAGAGSVSYHLTAYAGKKDNHLFVGASLGSPFWPSQRTVPEMEFQYRRLLSNTNCSTLACLRSVDIATFQAASNNGPLPDAASNDPLPVFYWLPVIDDDLVVDRMYNLFGRGSFIHVPVLVGDDTNEGSVFAFNASNPAEVSTFLRNNYPNLSSTQLQEINDLYPLMDPLPQHNAYFPSASASYGDCTFTCAGNEIASALARHFDPQRVWNYRYNVLEPEFVAAGLGVPHGAGSSAIVGTGLSPSYYTTNAEIVPIMMHYWVSFVRFLNPNRFKAPQAPQWEPWGLCSGKRVRVEANATGMEVVPWDLTRKCAFWRRLSGITEK